MRETTEAMGIPPENGGRGYNAQSWESDRTDDSNTHKNMGRITQFLDYLNREPDGFSADFVKANYTHFSITEKSKDIRKKLKWYRPLKKK